MKRIDIIPKDIDYKEYQLRDALITDVSTLIKDECVIYVNDEPVIFYMVLPPDILKHIRWAVKNIKYGKTERTGGLKTQSKIFGYMPRNAIRSDFCHIAAMSQEEEKQHKVITDFGKILSDYYKEHMPTHFNYHQQVVEEKVLQDWKIEGTPFTSGIVNKNNKLKYHLDSGNFKNLLSNMVVLKRDVEGGHLVIPELDIALECPDGAIVLFNGQNILHGVSEIFYNNPSSYRYSVVYYSLEQMWKCEPLDLEIDRIRNVKTEREKNRANPEHIEKLKEQIMGEKKKWSSLIYNPTPVEKIGSVYFKREDLFKPAGKGINGAKLRQLIYLVDKWKKQGYKGVISGAVTGSPQHPFISSVCAHFGMECIIITGGKDVDKYPYLKYAKDMGATIISFPVGYAKTLESQAFKLQKQIYTDYVVLETNITLDEKWNTPSDIRDFHMIGAQQAKNIPSNIETLIIPAGSCNSITSILLGITQYPPESLKKIIIMGIGNNGSNNLNYIPNRLRMMTEMGESDLSAPFGFNGRSAKYEIEYHNLNGSGYCKYEDLMEFNYEGLEFHPRYEGKIMNYIMDNFDKFRSVWNDKTMFWIVGGKI